MTGRLISWSRRIRVHFLDWLRALALLGVFFYHSLQPFSTRDLWMHILGSAAVIAIMLLPAAHDWGHTAPMMRPARSPGAVSLHATPAVLSFVIDQAIGAMKIVYFYWMKDDDRVRTVASEHAAYGYLLQGPVSCSITTRVFRRMQGRTSRAIRSSVLPCVAKQGRAGSR